MARDVKVTPSYTASKKEEKEEEGIVAIIGSAERWLNLNLRYNNIIALEH